MSGEAKELPASNGWTVRRAVGWAAVPVAGFALAFWLRYEVIQPEDVGILCARADAPGWCAPRQWLILGQHYALWGWIALASAAAALLIGLPAALLRILLATALFFSALALVLYNATLGAIATVLALLALLRS